ncbi:Protease synthase and sporulation negative regulatory protein PAI 1 [compost metagenome]
MGFSSPTPLQSNNHVYDINIAIHPDYQRRGIGRKLMDEMKVIAEKSGVRKLSLRVLASNPNAISFYKSCGFIEQGRLVEEFYLDGRFIDDILMWCPVPALVRN